ncbi:MAG: flagellar export protein FliJ [Clostridium argentinense]|uniref:Flagellar FliJ protein n=1 Tax=Clostridium faecium TaxID=2762223 RepID=A0ABR8YRC2_9CLOT|nr:MULTISPECIES: flagellar export protein FliJ [Clostridium]MBD8046434.1 flagellar export protein FliJ [Clostridium faecium]MBS5825147.1 flagellar export protein FliJ [Clostridium argentinense]MDU1348947.1 flagellar export protein FliJ [Clostridium argentinense]
MSYKFRLQKLLEFRQGVEDQSKISFMEAMSEKNRVERKLNNLQDSYDKYKNIPLNLSTIEKKITQNYLNAVNNSIKDTTMLLDEKEIIVEEKREKLVKSQVERKTVEILKEKDYRRYLDEENRKEQNQIDEFALYGYVRNIAERR